VKHEITPLTKRFIKSICDGALSRCLEGPHFYPYTSTLLLLRVSQKKKLFLLPVIKTDKAEVFIGLKKQ
jgi:hypothetical protein